MSTVVITGGAGFIGSHLADQLVLKGYEVKILDNLSTGKENNIEQPVTFIKGDILSPSTIQDISKGVDCIFHLAALPRVQYSIMNPVESNDVNVNGTIQVLEAARLNGVRRVVFAASSSAYGDQEVYPSHENLLPHPLSPYGLQKLIGEQYMRLYAEIYNVETVSLRFFNVYGPRINLESEYSLVLGKFIKQTIDGHPLTIVPDGNQSRDFTSVHDVVRGIISAGISDSVGEGEVINLGAGRDISVNTIASLIGGETIFIEPRIEPKKTLADIGRARELLKWEPQVKFEDGLQELKTFYGI